MKKCLKVILYFDGTQEMQYLNDRNKNATSEELDISESEVLDGDRVIQEQSLMLEILFNIEDEEMSVPTICRYIEENEVY